MNRFIDYSPSLESYWRSVILFGKNSASYKFSLGKSLLDLVSKEKTFISLEELAVPFSEHICSHLNENDRQGNSSSSKFLNVCRQYNNGSITQGQLIEDTAKLGFQNVIDCFHNVNNQELPVRFFMDDRKTKGGITITDDLLSLKNSVQLSNLPCEVESRWKLVETAWNLGVSPNLLNVQYDDNESEFFVLSKDLRRKNVTSCRGALNGYQKGKCFYSFSDISAITSSDSLCDVDHFFPHTLKQYPEFAGINLDGVWNLVLSSRQCNRGTGGKSAKIPVLDLVKRLSRRNEFLIHSHHPLRETLINQTGKTSRQRNALLQQIYQKAVDRLVHTWQPQFSLEQAF